MILNFKEKHFFYCSKVTEQNINRMYHLLFHAVLSYSTYRESYFPLNKVTPTCAELENSMDSSQFINKKQQNKTLF